jgi:hypothetical protein
MITLYALGLILATSGTASDTSFAVARVGAPPIQLWMNGDRRFREGERVRVQVETEVDGFLLVLHSDTEGRVRVLFPVEPRDDALVQARRRYEVRAADNARDAFVADYEGTGLVWAAVAADPWRFEEISRDGRWDYGRLDVDRDADPERALTDLAQRISSSRGFDYDVLGYRVYGSSLYTASYYPRPIYIYDDYLFCGGWNWRFHGCNRWPLDGGFHISVGYGGFYDPWYYPYRYRYGYGYGYPYRPYYPYYPVRPPIFVSGNRPYVAGRPRGYTIERRGFGGAGRTFAGAGDVGRGSTPINWRERDPERSRSRPSTRESVGGVFGPAGGTSTGSARPSRGDGGGNDRPTALPARPRGSDRDGTVDRGGTVPSARPQSGGDRGTPRPAVERSRGNGRSRGDLQITDGSERVPAASAPGQASGETGPARRARSARSDDPGEERLVRRGGSTATERGNDGARPASRERYEAPPAARSEPRAERRAPPAARSEPRAERRASPAARSEPRAERRAPPAARSEPRAERRAPPAARSESRGGRSAPPPSARSAPRTQSPPAARSAPARGDGGARGGRSAPSRSRGRPDNG